MGSKVRPPSADLSDLGIGIAVSHTKRISSMRETKYIVQSSRETWWPAAGESLAIVLLVSNMDGCEPRDERPVRMPVLRWRCNKGTQAGVKGFNPITIQPLWMHL